MLLDSTLPTAEVTYSAILFTLVSISLVFFGFFGEPGLFHAIPAVGVENTGFFKLTDAKNKWLRDGKSILEQGVKQFSGCFQVFTSVGPKIVIPNRLADEIRNNPHMSFAKAIYTEFFGSYPGFEPFNGGDIHNILVEAVRGKLTQSLNHITADLSDEATKSISEVLGEPQSMSCSLLMKNVKGRASKAYAQWTEITIKPQILQLVARLSSRVFVGTELCENDDWLALTKEYTVNVFVATRALREWPAYIRPFVHWFLPECRQIRRDLQEARRILNPVVEQRRERNRKARDEGKSTSKVADTIGWFDDAAKGRPYDIAVAQLSLSFAAIHTTSELLSGTILDLCEHTEYLEPLREEIRTALRDNGWKKTSLYELRLMDSVMKESQRHHFGDIAAMSRLTEEPISLSDGTTIPKGAMTMVAIDRMHDPSVFPEPNAYNGRRFLEMRQKPGNENRWQFVTTSPEHLAFGHGKHACPGRFFASNEIKVALCHLLMKYDWKLSNDGRPTDRMYGQDSEIDPTAKVLFRRRNEELPL